MCPIPILWVQFKHSAMPESWIQVCIVTRQQRIPYTLPFNASYPFFCEENPVSGRIPDSSFVLPFQDTLSIKACVQWGWQDTLPWVGFFFFLSFLKISVFMCDLQCSTDDYSAHHLQKTATLISFTLLLTEINQYPDWLKHLAASHSALSPHASPWDAGKWLNCNTEPWEQ